MSRSLTLAAAVLALTAGAAAATPVLQDALVPAALSSRPVAVAEAVPAPDAAAAPAAEAAADGESPVIVVRWFDCDCPVARGEDPFDGFEARVEALRHLIDDRDRFERVRAW